MMTDLSQQKASHDVTETSPSPRSVVPSDVPERPPVADDGPVGLRGRRTSASTTASFRAVRDVDLRSTATEITAFIGPSGCGKTTVLRCFNRMNDLIPGARVEGTLALPRRRPLRPRRVARRGAPPHRHGVPEAEPVPEVDLRQRRLRPARQRHRGRRPSSTTSSSARCAAPRCGTRSRTGSSSRRSACRAVSSSGSASRARSPSSPR